MDGDADGVEGGDFNYWFRVARDVAQAAPGQPKTIFVDKLSNDSFADGSLGAPYETLSAAIAASAEGDIIRVLPNGGADGLVSTQQDNLAYEIGLGGPTNSALADGSELIVPKGVAVVVDAGALFKLRQAKISVGSEAIDDDRSLASFQVLGTPTIANEDGSGEVFFTSWDDESLGVDTNPLSTTPQPGQWAGIEFRNDFDYSEGRGVWETEGIFLDFVSHANIQYGGGSIDLNEPIVTPLQMNESRPTLIYNTITSSGDAAISADPNSFLETNFHAANFQRVAAFTSDYDRVGPELSGNRVVGNSINGLFIRVETPAAGELEPMTVSGRFDDRDIVHVMGQVLVLQGQPGGAVLLEERPDVLSVAVNPMGVGTLDPLTSYDYRLTYVTADGSESLASLPTSAGVTGVGGALQLANLPQTPDEFAGRRLYRSVPGTADYVFVTQLDRVADTFHDLGDTRGGLLAAEIQPDATAVAQIVDSGDGGRLTPGETYSYRLTFTTQFGGETQASAESDPSSPTATFAADDNGSIVLTNLPTAPDGFSGVNLYRSITGSNDYELVVELSGNTTTYEDDGRNVDLPQRILANEGNNGLRLLPRFDARLSIDPGVIVKSETSRIEATFGADFYAEGTDGNEIVFTSRLDDSFGAGGTFDTTNDGGSSAAAGDWGGLIFRQDSTASLDHVQLRYGGGSTPVNGTFTPFNVVEILQADVRVTNSTIVDNADGFLTASTRDGVGFNEPATIFVRGSQPILVGNTIESNVGAAISINADSLNQAIVKDHGRSTGAIDLVDADSDNQGPLILGNRLDENTYNGLRIRSELLTTDSVWDDTDIVHVVEGQIASATHHYYGALRLKSDPDQSLVVKLGAGAELVGTGRPLDIEDRIGGTLQVIGTPGHPVILTSLQDASVGAGFTATGEAQNETVAPTTGPSPGDWQGLRLGTFVNDRNVAYVLETEPADGSSNAINATANTAQLIGALAASETASDENERLGFTIKGALGSEIDSDVYTFTATGGTAVFIDIDESSVGLDTVVELIDSNDNVLARSDDSFHEAVDSSLLFSTLSDGAVQPLYQLGVGNVESPSPLDAGMRVILPGSSATENDYFVRVRSNGVSSGSYELNLRLRETQEVAGSTIVLADIRFANEAITLPSAPLHSPLTSTAAETLDFSTIIDPTPLNPNSGDEYVQETVNSRLTFANADAVQLGNLGSSDRGALSVSGTLGNLSDFDQFVQMEDVDVYQVDLFTQELGVDVFDEENRYISATFDIDYADGLGRPNTSLAVYDSTGRLVAYGSDSGVDDDLGRPLNGVDSENLAGGSAGPLDAYVGPIELPEGTYFVAVTNVATVPADLDQFFNPNSANTEARLIPVNSTRRLIEDSFDDSDLFFTPAGVPSSAPAINSLGYSAEQAVIEPGFDFESAVPYALDDIRLFVSLDTGISGTNQTSLVSVNPYTGVVERLIGQDAQPLGDIAARADGELFGYTVGPPVGAAANNGNIGDYWNLSPVDGTANNIGDGDDIEFFRSNAAFDDVETDGPAQLIVNALAFQLENNRPYLPTVGFATSTTRNAPVATNGFSLVVGERDAAGRLGEVPADLRQNIVYLASQGTGEISSFGSFADADDRNFDAPNGDNLPYIPGLHGTGSDEIEIGVIDTGNIFGVGDGGVVQGVAFDPDVPGVIFAATDAGGIHSFEFGDFVDAPAGSPYAGYQQIIPTTFHGVFEKNELHELLSFIPNQPPSFTSLSMGPRLSTNGLYRNTLFATTDDGWLYAIDIDDNGNLVPANVFLNGRSAIQLSFTGATFTDLGLVTTGLAFSNLEASPWHLTGDRGTDDGHGLAETVDLSRTDGLGGTSLYFGFETPEGNVLSLADDSTLGEVAPGGVHGSVITRSINLEGYSASEKPTLYFSYFIEVEDSDDYNPPQQQQHDSFRVFAAGDDGLWQMLATNNNFRNEGAADEFDYFDSTGTPVQELFDDEGAWRQARVDLSQFAGNENVRIRFDVSTAGAMRSHFDSLELVAVAGDEIIDGDIATFVDGFGNRVLLESVLGSEVLFGTGAEINVGDVLTLSGPEISDSVTFVAGAAGPGEVQIDPAMTAEEVVVAVIAALDQRVSGYNVGGGLAQFEAIDSVVVTGDSKIGETSPVLVQRNASTTLEAAQVTVPAGLDIADGDSFTITSGTTVDTFTFVTVPTGAPNEVLFTPADSQDDVAERLLSIIPNVHQAIYEGDGVITVLFEGAEIDPSDLEVESRAVNESAVVLTLPSVADVRSGVDTFTVTLKTDGPLSVLPPVTRVLVEAADAMGTPDEIVYDAGAITTSAELADVVLAQLDSNFQGYRVGDRQIYLLNAQIVEVLADSQLVGGGVAEAGNAPIIVDNTMSTRQVTERLRIAINEGVGQFVFGSTDATPIDTFISYGGDRIRLYDLTPLDAGVFGVSAYVEAEGFTALSPVPGDGFGLSRSAAFAANQISVLGATNNEVEGVYIDDVIVGFAGRGELVLDGSNSGDFTLDPSYLPGTHPDAVQPERENETLVGPYALEIRTSEEFGVAQDYDGVELLLDEQLGLGRSFDVNDRLVDGAVSLLTIGGTELLDGDTFVLYDGWRELTFEFDSLLNQGVTPGNVAVEFDPADPDAALVAEAIRDAINSPQVQNVLQITAATSDGFESGPSTGNRVELFGSANIVVNPSGGRFIKSDLVAAETSQGRETARQIPISDQVAESVTAGLFGDELARSTPTGFVDAQRDTFVGIGKIGDAVQSGQVGIDDGASILGQSPGADFDSVRVYLEAGESVDIDVDTTGFSRAGAILDVPVITVFDAGEELTEERFDFIVDPARQTSLFNPSSAPGEADGGAYLQFSAPADGFYDVVVSSVNIFGTQEINFFEGVPAAAYDTQSITIVSGLSQAVYEYTLDPLLVSPNVVIVLDPADTPDDIAAKTAQAIKDNQPELFKVDLEGNNINLFDVGDSFATIIPSLFFPGRVAFRALDYGEYSLTIRPTAASGNVPSRDVLMVDYQFGSGDTNRVADQGQLIIASNFISDTAGSGIRAVSDQRGQTLVNVGGANVTTAPDQLPSPGSASLLRNQNTEALIPGVVITNNVIANSGDAAIEFGGDVNVDGEVASPVSFGRIVNNTVVNEGSGDGIRISGAASPTVLNNIFSGFSNGLLTTGTQFGEVVVGGNAYQDNGTDTTVGLAASSFVIPTGVPLFQDPARGIYIPAEDSAVIDSSFASLPDRIEFLQTVKEPVGISASPIIAPEFDAYGQRRVDDPDVTNPGGVGSNVFIDRGAIDRADEVRPTAVLTVPQDAIGVQVVGGDQDPDASFVRLTEGTVSFFEIQLLDPSGTGIDASTVNVNSVIVTENGNRLTAGQDYIFGYSTNSNSIRLTPLTGIWRPDAVYEITLNNKLRTELPLPSGDSIADGDQIVIEDTSGTQTRFEFESGFSLVLPQTSTLTVSGTNAEFADGELISVTSPSLVVRELEFDTDGAVIQPGAIAIDISSAGTIEQVRDAILATLGSVDPIDPSMTVAEALGLSPVAVGLDQIQLGTLAGHFVNESAAALSLDGVAGGVVTGDSFTYDAAGTQVTFEFTETVVSDPAFTPIPFSITDTPAQIAQAAADAVANASLGLSPIALPDGRVVLGGQVGDIATASSATVSIVGNPGVSPGAISLDFVPSSAFTSSLVAATLQNAIRDSGIAVSAFNPGGGSLFLDGVTSVTGIFGGVSSSLGAVVPAVSDLAANRVRETRINDETRFTIVMPEVVFDLGDAPDTFGTTFAANGARHTISGSGLPRLGFQLDDETDGQPLRTDDAPIAVNPVAAGLVLAVSSPSAHTFTISATGTAPTGGETLDLTIGLNTITFELVRANDNPTIGNVPIVFATGESSASIMEKLFLGIRAEFAEIGAAVLMSLAGDTITLEAIDDEDGVSTGIFTSGTYNYIVFTEEGTDPIGVVGDDVVGFINPLDPAGSTIPVRVTGSGVVDIFLDYDQNGVFNQDEEHVAQNVAVVDGLNLINIPQEAAPAGDVWMRVRLSQGGDLTSTGVAVGGEVEDYLVSVVPLALPTPIDDSYNAIEDTLLVVDAMASQPTLYENDLDINIQLLPVRYFVDQEPSNGTLTVTDNRAGEFTYLPDPDFYGTDTFTYRLSTQENSNAGVNSTFATVTITVAPVNDTPGVEDKLLTGLEDTVLPIDQSVFLAGTTGHFNPAIPTPPLDESIQDIKLVAITTSSGTINAANQAAALTTPEGATLTASFDTDITTGRTFITEVFYSPPTDFNADNLPLAGGLPRLDEFTFTIEDDGKLELPDGTIVDGTPLTNTATASVRVTPQNDAPTLSSDLVSISDASYQAHFTDQGLPVPTPTEDMALLIPAAFLISNDLPGTATTDDETQGIRGNDGPLRIVSASVDPFFGTLELLPSGDLSFVPADDIYGQVEFTYEVEDQGVDEAIDGTRVLNPMRTSITSTIFLEPVNDAPVAYDRSFTMTEAVEPAGPAVLSFTAADLLNGAGVLNGSPLMTTASSITVVDGTAMQDGETILLTDSLGQTAVIEFSTDATPSIGTDLLLTYTLAESADNIATNLAALLVNAGFGGVASGATVSLPVTTAAATSTFTTGISADTVGVSIPDPLTIVGGESITVTDSDGVVTVLELSTNGVAIGTPDALINFTPGVDSAAAIVALIRAELLGRGIGSIDAGGVAPQSSLQFNATSVDSLSEPTTNLSLDPSGNLVIVDGVDLIDGETVTLNDGLGGTVVIEFNTTNIPSAGTDVLIEYDFFDTGAGLALELEAALRLLDLGVTALNDTLVFKSVTAADAAPPVTSITATPNEIVLPNGAQIIDGETVDLTIDGQGIVVEFNSTGVLSPGSTHVVTVDPVDTADVIAAALESTLRADGFSATASGDTVDILSVASLSVTELPDVAGDFADGLIPPYNEIEQTLRVVTFATSAGVLDADVVGDNTATLMTDNGGQLELIFSGGLFVSGTYTPPVDYNELPPFQATELFTYGIADDGQTTLPFSNLVRDLDDERSVEMATVTITVEPSNDAPVFTTPDFVEVLEDDFGTTIPDVVTNVLPAASTALDELATQTVSFTVEDALSTVPAGLMTQSPVVTSTGGLTVFPAPDAVGTAIYVIRGTDDHPTNPQSTDATVTVHVRPVNDAPRFDANVAGTSDANGPDEAYTVARQIDPTTGDIVDATITYTLREDNTQALGVTEPYFIPLQRDPSVVGYNQVGLLDVFTVGPPNEADGTLGGDQTLNLFDFPTTTLLGGTLTEVRDTNNVVIGLNYIPPLNFNEVIGGNDTFVYTVQDGAPAGETFDLAAGGLVSDQLTATNVVQFRLNPVNDKPEFNLNLLREDQSDPTSPFRPIETPEDSAVTIIDNFAFNINAGPPATAFDEVDVLTGQTVQFSVTSLGFPPEQAADFFSEFPTISPDGQLRFLPAPDVFGSFDFEIVLTDDGPGDSTRGDLISSDPVTVTIDVLPINDPPVVVPGVDLSFTLDEDRSIDIPITGDMNVAGLLDAFIPGPANESADLTPGGNQTVSIQEPTPVATASGGSLQRVLDGNNELVALRYTPRANFVGLDSFIYTVVDDGVTVDIDTDGTVRDDPRIASNTVSLNVLPLNDAPQFSGANNVTVNEDVGPTEIANWATNVLAGPVTATDELDSQTIQFEIVQIGGPQDLFASAPVAVVNDDDTATLQFEPAGDANGLGTFTVQLIDDGLDDATLGHDNTSDVRTFTIRVNAINDPPTFTTGGLVTVNEDSGPFAEQWATDVSPGPADESDQSVRFEVSTPVDAQDLFQSLPEISDDGILRFIPASNANGTVDLTVTAIDSGGAASTPITLRLVITAVNDTPTAVADELTTDEDAVLVIPSSQLLANDIDPDLGNPGDTLTVVRPAQGFSLSGATIVYDAVTGDLTYDPSTSTSLQALAPGETAVDSFSYSVIDLQGAESNLVTVALTVSGINDAPVAQPDTPTLNPDGPTLIPVLDNDSDVDGTINPASIEITLQPAFGSLSIDEQTGVITFTAFQAFSEEDQFRYTVEDDLGAVSESVLVTIAANAAPIARDDQDATFLEEDVDINVVANDFDPDADINAPDGGLDLGSILIVSPPANGAAVPLGDGTVRYIPDDGFIGLDTFQYTIADSEGRRSLAADVQVQVVASRLQNPNQRFDVNNDGDVSPIDALLVINHLARAGIGSIPVELSDVGPPFYDVNGDQTITALDALLVINELGRRSSSGEAEQVFASDVVDAPLLDLISDRDDDDDDRVNAVDQAFGDLI
ncbi:MAG: tandem-95 repeat protein [Planctomycetota bacterium]